MLRVHFHGSESHVGGGWSLLWRYKIKVQAVDEKIRESPNCVLHVTLASFLRCLRHLFPPMAASLPGFLLLRNPSTTLYFARGAAASLSSAAFFHLDAAPRGLGLACPPLAERARLVPADRRPKKFVVLSASHEEPVSWTETSLMFLAPIPYLTLLFFFIVICYCADYFVPYYLSLFCLLC